MRFLFIVNRHEEWPFEIPATSSATARGDITDAAFGTGIEPLVVNLCRVDRYQGRGYYVSLLAEARGHRPLPDVKTIEELQSPGFIARLGTDLDEILQTSLAREPSDRVELDVYFGR